MCVCKSTSIVFVVICNSFRVSEGNSKFAVSQKTHTTTAAASVLYTETRYFDMAR